MSDEVIKAAATAVVDKAKTELNTVSQALDAKARSFVTLHKLGYLLLAGASFGAGLLVRGFL